MVETWLLKREEEDKSWRSRSLNQRTWAHIWSIWRCWYCGQVVEPVRFVLGQVLKNGSQGGGHDQERLNRVADFCFEKGQPTVGMVEMVESG